MEALKIHQFPYGESNYGVLVHAPESGETACVDAGDGDAVLKALNDNGWRLTHLLITHHHGDHTAGIGAVKSATGCRVYGPAPKSNPIEGLDETLDDGAAITFAGRKIEVLATPGHTLDMINYHLPDDRIVFTGDTLFALGCGRVFEGDAKTMWGSLQKLSALPPSTHIYCGHEYTLANARFALTVDPDNQALQRRAEEVAETRKRGEPTVPSVMRLELETNPFLRPASASIRDTLGMADAEDWEVFAEIRKRKDRA